MNIPKAIETAKRLREFAAVVSASRGDLHYPVFSFIAAARNDTPLLCDAVEELAKENERLRRALKSARKFIKRVGPDWWVEKQRELSVIDAALAEKE